MEPRRDVNGPRHRDLHTDPAWAVAEEKGVQDRAQPDVLVSDPPATPGTRRAAAGTSSIGTRVRGAVLAVWAAITGAAPHVLHHVGPLAGSALVAGVGGRAPFGLAGFIATILLLRRLRRRTGSWRAPALALVAFAAIYTVSTVLVGPAIGGVAGAPFRG